MTNTYQHKNYRIKKDSNHVEIVKAIKKMGCTVLDLAEVGRGCPDILVGIEGNTGKYNILMEIKSEKGRLRDDQKDFMDKWQGSVAVIRSIDDAKYIIAYYQNH